MMLFFIKPVVELLLVLVFPISSRQRRLLKLLEQMSFMVGERGKYMWKRNELWDSVPLGHTGDVVSGKMGKEHNIDDEE